ncbi:glycogen debranching enzyme, partial [Streptomyces sp. SID69]|nr:glycogen debranching enzyme [Streptomyces sp. SID69]
PLWTEWNGKYRDTVRDFWRGEGGTLGEFASRLTGSSDLYQSDGRRPYASVNFVTAHDGFTLRDLVSYDGKHNEANGEENRDGENHNRSWNCGVEGATRDRDVLALRARQQRNLLATLLLSQGVPMLLHGDELGRTQHGNNNAYCQDGELAWIDWPSAIDGSELLDFTRRLITLRRDHPVFRRRRFFKGRVAQGSSADGKDITWFTPAGREMNDTDWDTGFARSLMVHLNGKAITEPDLRGLRVADDSFLLLFNAHSQALSFTLPEEAGRWWAVEVDTAIPYTEYRPLIKGGSEVEVEARAMLVLRGHQDE